MQEMWVLSWVKKISWSKKWQLTPVVLPGKFHGQRSLSDYSPQGLQESDTTEQLSTHTQIESESCSVVSDSWRPCGLYSQCDSSGQNTEVGSLSLLQRIFPIQGSNPGLPHCRRILYQLSQKGSPIWICVYIISQREECALFWLNWGLPEQTEVMD